jgi:hypothetical protein
MTIQQQLKGWGFDMTALKGEGAFLSPPKVPRAFSTNVSNETNPINNLKEDEWCNYANMPSPKAYMNE